MKKKLVFYFVNYLLLKCFIYFHKLKKKKKACVCAHAENKKRMF